MLQDVFFVGFSTFYIKLHLHDCLVVSERANYNNCNNGRVTSVVYINVIGTSGSTGKREYVITHGEVNNYK